MQWDIGRPNPRQIEFFKARARFIAYGGARGGGKSWAVRKKAAGLALSYPGAGILIVPQSGKKPSQHSIKTAILPKNVECCDGLARKCHFHHKGARHLCGGAKQPDPIAPKRAPTIAVDALSYWQL